MTVDKTVVVNFSEKDKEALYHLYKMLKSACCDNVACQCCPWDKICEIAFGADDELKFIDYVRREMSNHLA